MAATRARGRVTGKLLEDENASILKESDKSRQRKKQKYDNARNERVVAQNKSDLNKNREFEELPYVEVLPLPNVARGQNKEKNDVRSGENSDNQKQDVVKLIAEPGFKNRAPLQADARAKDLKSYLRQPMRY